MKVIGLSGTNGSGKDTIAHLLVAKYGYYFASATDMLGDELTRRGLPHERENKRQVSSEWRHEFGLGVIVDKAVAAAKAAGYTKVVVGSLRHSGEVERVHQVGGTMIWVDADPKVRYDRIQNSQRGRVEDQKTFEQFLAEEKIEMHPTGDHTTLDMAKVKEMADWHIENNTADIEKFKHEVEEQLKDLL